MKGVSNKYTSGGLLLLFLVMEVNAAILWKNENCNRDADNEVAVWGVATDAICCSGTTNDGPFREFCEDHDTKGKCAMEDRCIWKVGLIFRNGSTIAEGKCKPNRDAVNNVCCRPQDVMENCLHVLNGSCPLAWRILTECCPAPYNKYSTILDTGDNSTVCCNAPCTAIEKAFNGNATTGIAGLTHCRASELSVNCGPGARSSLSNMNLFGGGDISPFTMSQLMSFPVGSSFQLGQSDNFFNSVDNVMHSALYGKLDMMAGLAGMMSGDSKDVEEEVQEITVDDFFNGLIEALASDDDVLDYKSDIISSPSLGKQEFSGFNPFSSDWKSLMLAIMSSRDGAGFSYPTYLNPFSSSKRKMFTSPWNHNLHGNSLNYQSSPLSSSNYFGSWSQPLANNNHYNYPYYSSYYGNYQDQYGYNYNHGQFGSNHYQNDQSISYDSDNDQSISDDNQSGQSISDDNQSDQSISNSNQSDQNDGYEQTSSHLSSNQPYYMSSSNYNSYQPYQLSFYNTYPNQPYSFYNYQPYSNMYSNINGYSNTYRPQWNTYNSDNSYQWNSFTGRYQPYQWNYGTHNNQQFGWNFYK